MFCVQLYWAAYQLLSVRTGKSCSKGGLVDRQMSMREDVQTGNTIWALCQYVERSVNG